MLTAASIPFACACKNRRAFTLVEMSLVLIVIGLVILTVFPALRAVREGSQRTATQSNMNSVHRALAAFVQAQGCLPCPAPPSASPAGWGRVRGDAAGPACGTCPLAEGLVPYVSLGLSQATARDGWGRWLTFRIDPDLAIHFGVVPPTLPCTASDPAPCTLGASQKGLCSAGLKGTNTVLIRLPQTTVTQPAAFIILSHGPNGYGSYRTSANAPASTNMHPSYGGPSATCSTTGGYERCNSDGDAVFVAGELAEISTNPFDDILLYAGRNALVSLLGNGACHSAWEIP
jgi:prepilin-type N-terminal cleavage/methylation domain-containing protein